MVKYGSIQAADKALDSQPGDSHKFLEQRAVLVEALNENPGLRMTATTNIFGNPEEYVTVEDQARTGLKGPKTRFMELSKYTKKFGAPLPEKVKTNVYNGVSVQGVDIILSEDTW